jgi:hypothetical protein
MRNAIECVRLERRIALALMAAAAALFFLLHGIAREVVLPPGILGGDVEMVRGMPETGRRR